MIGIIKFGEGSKNCTFKTFQISSPNCAYEGYYRLWYRFLYPENLPNLIFFGLCGMSLRYICSHRYSKKIKIQLMCPFYRNFRYHFGTRTSAILLRLIFSKKIRTLDMPGMYIVRPSEV